MFFSIVCEQKFNVAVKTSNFALNIFIINTLIELKCSNVGDHLGN